MVGVTSQEGEAGRVCLGLGHCAAKSHPPVVGGRGRFTSRGVRKCELVGSAKTPAHKAAAAHTSPQVAREGQEVGPTCRAR